MRDGKLTDPCSASRRHERAKIDAIEGLPVDRDGRGIRDRCAALLFVVVVSLALAGCGKRGPPEPPPGEPVTYPRNYPSE